MNLPSNFSVSLFQPKPHYANYTLPLVRSVNAAVGRALPLAVTLNNSKPALTAEDSVTLMAVPMMMLGIPVSMMMIAHVVLFYPYVDYHVPAL